MNHISNHTKSVEQLIARGLAISETEPSSNHLGFIGRSIVLATLPHRNPKELHYTKQNGPYRLSMLAHPDVGLPYGSLPRLVLVWLTTEAVKTQSRDIDLGDSMASFMRDLGIQPTGGKNGSIPRLKSQVEKLFGASITAVYNDGKRWAMKNVTPISRTNLWWETKNPEQLALFNSTVRLNEDFYQEIIANPIPVDKRALRALKQSPLSLDIYQWLTYRHSYTTKPVAISWSALENQFGANYTTTRKFKQKFAEAYKRVEAVYPGARLRPANEGDGVLLLPSRSHIKKKPKIIIDE